MQTTPNNSVLQRKQAKTHKQNYLAEQIKNVTSKKKLTKKEKYIYQQIHRAIVQRISVGSRVTTKRVIVCSNSKFERVTLLIQSAVTQLHFMTLPHRRQAITLFCLRVAMTNKTEPLRVAA
jgi:hypothetical protein